MSDPNREYPTIPLWPNAIAESDAGTINEGCPSATLYLLEGEGPFPLMVVCPGGGYTWRAPHEGHPIALWLNSIGVSAVVLNYRVAPYRHPVPLQDAQRAVRMARHYAGEWNVDASRVGILGFSAGGHLAASVGTHYDFGDVTATDGIDRQSSRPDLMVLCYAVISFDEQFGHSGTRASLLGQSPDELDRNLADLLSNERQVTSDTPPVFLWWTADDDLVPIEHCLLFAAALRKHGVPFGAHIYESGVHGLGLAADHVEAYTWPLLCQNWLRQRKFI